MFFYKSMCRIKPCRILCIRDGDKAYASCCLNKVQQHNNAPIKKTSMPKLNTKNQFNSSNNFSFTRFSNNYYNGQQ
jgi:hypothetical protein